MKKGKAPGRDGLSVEFYTQCWSIVKNDFVNALKEMYSTQTIETESNPASLPSFTRKDQKPKFPITIPYPC